MKRSTKRAGGTGTSRSRDPLAALADAFREGWRRFLKRRRRCLEEPSKRAFHRSRVQSLRLVSQMALLKEIAGAKSLGKVRRALKRHHALLRDVRDVQVQRVVVAKLEGDFPEAAPFSLWLRKREKRAIHRALSGLRRVPARRVGSFVDGFQRKLRKRHPPSARGKTVRSLRRVVDQAFARAIRRERRVQADDTRTIHRERVALKRLVYMLEALPPAVSGVTPRACRQMRDCVEAMGSIQDAEIVLAALDRFARKSEKRTRAVAGLRARLMRRREELVGAHLRSRPDLETIRPPRRDGSPSSPHSQR